MKGSGAWDALFRVGRDAPGDDVADLVAMAMTYPNHPAAEVLRRFVLGRLDRRTMARVEAHLVACLRCARVAATVPDDRLVALLRRPDIHAWTVDPDGPAPRAT